MKDEGAVSSGFHFDDGMVHQVLQKMDEGVAVFDQEENFLFANQTFYRLTSLDEKELRARKSNLLGGLDGHKEKLKEIRESVLQGNGIQTEMLLSRSDGTAFWADLDILPVTGEKGRIRHIVTMIRDISETRKREAELRKAMDLAEEAGRIKERFIAGMSHEIRTPMSGILGMAQLLGRSGLDEEQQDYLEAIESSAKSLINILSDVIEFAQMEAADIVLEEKPFSLEKVLDTLSKLFENRAEKKEISFELEMDSGLEKLLIGDRKRFLQIMMQLVGNSFKFTESGGVQVTATSELLDQGNVNIRIRIVDSGIGIPKEAVTSVFESFSKASRSTMSSYGGTGLGMSIVKKVVDLMNGDISVESEEGEGTKVDLKIPFRLQSDSGSDTSSSTSLKPDDRSALIKGKRILVADDHPVNRKLLEGMLKKLGVITHSVADGNEVLEQLRMEPFDLVLMDVHMPDLNGLDATRAIRREFDPPVSQIPVIAVTASIMDADIEACKSAGMDGFIAKPFTWLELTDRIGSALQKETGALSGEKSTEQGADELSPEETVVDLAPLHEMTAGDTEMMIDMLELFLEQTPRLVQRMGDEWGRKEYADVGKTAHTLKPTFEYLGMHQVKDLVLSLEKCKESTSFDGLEEQIGERIKELSGMVERAAEQLKSELKKLKGQNDAS
ncbi:MAG: response regulator [Balneolaceae bacterium]